MTKKHEWFNDDDLMRALTPIEFTCNDDLPAITGKLARVILYLYRFKLLRWLLAMPIHWALYRNEAYVYWRGDICPHAYTEYFIECKREYSLTCSQVDDCLRSLPQAH